MADDPNKDQDDEFRDMLRDFLSGNSSIDPSQLAGAAGGGIALAPEARAAAPVPRGAPAPE